MLNPKVYTVAQVNRYIRGIFDNDFILQSLWVKGEISNFKKHSSGHLYFSLKDKDSAISCIMFKINADLMPFDLENGMDVTICGYVSVYEKTGQYQLYAEIVEPTGIGSLTMAFEQMKARLREEGLFDDDFKRDVCKVPKIVAVITSPTGAAVRDIINISKRRNKGVKLVIVPVLVQGDKASESIAKAIKDVNLWGKADTIIVGRGGGSLEDLWAFNEEVVARAIFSSEIPVISAVGHETDFTISDFVADLRAPTPSAAAELAINDLIGDLDRLNALRLRLNFSMTKVIEGRGKYVEFFSKNSAFRHVYENLAISIINIDRIKKDLDKLMSLIFEYKKQRFINNVKKLELLSPFSIMSRGYSIVFDEENNLITSVSSIQAGDLLKINLSDGVIDAIAKGVNNNNGEKKT